MKADLERLLISETELRELTGFDRQILLPLTKLTQRQVSMRRSIALVVSAIAFLTFASIFLPALRTAGIIFLISLTLGALSFVIEFAEVTVLCAFVALVSAIYMLYVLTGTTLGVILLCLGLAIVSGGFVFLMTNLIANWIAKRSQKSKHLNPKNRIPTVVIRLFKEVDKCNKIIGDIDIFDQLIDAGNSIKLESREAAIAALRMTRNDMVRALKTERILREHPEFHPDRFDIDLTAFESIQMGDVAQEYGRIFDTTLQIAIDVQQTMYELQQKT